VGDPLGVADEPIVRAADPSHVQAALTALTTRGSWLRHGHPFPNGSLPRNANQFNAITPSDIIELLSIRGPLHCIDGWSYLARALSALVCGDAHAARHLAYYAELRAALSILASAGIGIFDSQNRVIDASGSLRPLAARGTHDMCWAVFKFWGAEPASVEAILTAIKINGAPLIDALKVYFPGLASGSIGAQLLEEWGFDLRIGHEDRDERNLSSYNPTDLTSLGTLPPDDVAFIRSLWAAFEPQAWNFEKHLLRKLLEVQQSIVGDETIAARTNEYDRLDPRITAYVSADFLARRSEPDDHFLMTSAADIPRPASAHSMIARGALLLKIAVAMSEGNLTSAMVQPIVHLAPWWSDYGVARGLWAPDAAPSDMAELWQEIEDSLAELAAAQTSSRYLWLSERRSEVIKLCQAERVGLWNLCQ
jgi:hypothetical protein